MPLSFKPELINFPLLINFSHFYWFSKLLLHVTLSFFMHNVYMCIFSSVLKHNFLIFGFLFFLSSLYLHGIPSHPFNIYIWNRSTESFITTTLIPFSSSLTTMLTTAILNIDSFPYYYLLLPIQYNAIYYKRSVTDLQNTSVIHNLHVLFRIKFRVRMFYLFETCQASKPFTYCICSILQYLCPLARGKLYKRWLHQITESQNGWCWKRPQKIQMFNSPAQ